MKWVLFLLVVTVISCTGEIESTGKPTLSAVKPVAEVYKVDDIIILDLPDEPEYSNNDLSEQANEDLKKELAETKETIARLMADVQELKKIEPQKAKKEVPISVMLKDKAFKIRGHWGHGTNCRGLIYRKDFQESYMYLHVDCYGGYDIRQVRRR